MMDLQEHLSWNLMVFVAILTAYNGTEAILLVKEGDDFILDCSFPNTDLTNLVFDWKKDEQKEVFLYDAGSHYNNGRYGQDDEFHGRVSYFNESLKHGNASIKIRDAKLSDRGYFTCLFPHLDPKRLITTEVIVEPTLTDRSGIVKGASPVPYITTLVQTEVMAVLLCEVRGGFPEPKVEFQDSAGKVLRATEQQVSMKREHYYIKAFVTVTKTDNYSCVVTQGEIHHQTDFKNYVFISGEVSCINVVFGLCAVLVLVLVIVPGILFVLVKKRYIIIQRNYDRVSAGGRGDLREARSSRHNCSLFCSN